jgi:hypothetical protein
VVIVKPALSKKMMFVLISMNAQALRRPVMPMPLAPTPMEVLPALATTAIQAMEPNAPILTIVPA